MAALRCRNTGSRNTGHDGGLKILTGEACRFLREDSSIIDVSLVEERLGQQGRSLPGVGTDPKVFSPKSAEADIND